MNKVAKLLFINTLVLIVSAVCPSQISAQQNALYEIPGLLTVNSLIREYSPGKDVVFNQDGRSCFLMVERQSGVVTEAEVSGLSNVSDMEIDGDMLYFCGSYGGSQVIGYFDINDLFTGTNQVNIVTVPYAPVVNGVTPTLTLTKLEVLVYSSTDVHVFVLGDLNYGNPQLYTPDFTCLVDARFDGSIWQEEVISETSGVYFMDDLTVTQADLVVIGDKHGGTGDYWNSWNLPPAGNNTFIFANPVFINRQIYFTNDYDYYPISRPLIESRGGDKFVVASYGYFEWKYGVVLSLYTNPSTLADRWLVPDVAGVREFRDLKYNSANEMLYLQPDYFNTLCGNMLYAFDLQSMQVQAFQSNLPGVYSVDVLRGNPGAVASGMTQGGEVGVWRVDVAECECSRYMDLAVQRNAHQPHYFYLNFSYDTPKPQTEIEIASINNMTTNVFCGGEDFKKNQME